LAVAKHLTGRDSQCLVLDDPLMHVSSDRSNKMIELINEVIKEYGRIYAVFWMFIALFEQCNMINCGPISWDRSDIRRSNTCMLKKVIGPPLLASISGSSPKNVHPPSFHFGGQAGHFIYCQHPFVRKEVLFSEESRTLMFDLPGENKNTSPNRLLDQDIHE